MGTSSTSKASRSNERRALTRVAASCSLFVLMVITTLGEAWRLGWRVRARCFWTAPGGKSKDNRGQVQCDTSAELDMKTLVWTRGDLFPLDQLETRLKCPRCGARRVTVVFEVPNQPKAARQ
jgi:DNA-directed RNA polymerase subunit RPC12/RpoP